MKLIDRIDRKPVAVAFGMRRGAGGGASGDGGLSVLRNPESVSLVTPSGATALQAATPSIAGVLGAADKAKLDTLTETLATPTRDGLMAGADKAKLDGIEPGATADQSAPELIAAIDVHLGTSSWREGGAGGTGGGANLSVARDAASVTVESDDGTDAVLPSASAAEAGVMAAADKAKLDGIAPGAEVNPTAADIKAAYESNPDTNAFTDAERAKLAGIEPDATGDQSGAELVAAIDAVLGGTAWQAGGAGGTAGTNLSVTRAADALTVQSDTGSAAVLPAATGTEAGVMSAADKAKLDGLGSAGAGAGDMAVAVYDPQGIAGDAFDRTHHTGMQALGTVAGLEAALESKAAATHIHTATAITSGTLLHERGGLEADVSAYSGLLKISGGATSQAVPGTDYAAPSHTHTQSQVTGLGTADSPQFAGLNVGHATDTTITRASAGQIAVEGVNVSMAGHTHTQANITGLTASDSPQFVAINLGHATDTTLARSAAGQVTIEGVPVLTASNTASVTNKSIDAAQLTGTIPVARFNGGTGASTSTFLRGDGTWAAPAGGGMAASVYDPQGLARDAFARANHTGQQSIETVAGLQTVLDGKASVSHPHAIADVTGLQTTLDGKAASTHTHAIANVTGLQAALDGKAAAAHAHPESLIVAVSDETSPLTAGAGKITFRMPYALTLTDVRASVASAPSGAAIQVDINAGGSSILSTALSIDPSKRTSVTAAVPVVIGQRMLADDAEITVDIDQVGSGTAGAGLKITLIGTRG